MSYKQNIIYKTHRKIKEAISARKKIFLWKLKGCPIPPPPAIKQMINKYYAKKYDLHTFIETGTYMGEMIDAVMNKFSRIISIEYDTALAERAKKRYSLYNHIAIYHGDSGKILREIMPAINEPCLFWLDAHYSGGVTAQAGSETPIIEEIRTILEHSCSDHVVLIDDAREFTSNKNYPALEELKQIVKQSQKKWQMVVDNDIIRIHK
jgi:hypothetical protein